MNLAWKLLHGGSEILHEGPKRVIRSARNPCNLCQVSYMWGQWRTSHVTVQMGGKPHLRNSVQSDVTALEVRIA